MIIVIMLITASAEYRGRWEICGVLWSRSVTAVDCRQSYHCKYVSRIRSNCWIFSHRWTEFELLAAYRYTLLQWQQQQQQTPPRIYTVGYQQKCALLQWPELRLLPWNLLLLTSAWWRQPYYRHSGLITGCGYPFHCPNVSVRGSEHWRECRMIS